MLQIRKAADRGHLNHGWLDTYHTFSFGEYHDPQQMGFRALRVINEDRVAAGMGFDTHGHRDMEIITLVLEGALEHKDSMGNGEVLRPGEFQHMSAGRGIRHSEFNPSTSEPVHLYQIWLLPNQRGIQPAYGQKSFDPQKRQDRLQLVASPDGAEGSLAIQQDAEVYLATLNRSHAVEHQLKPGRHAWVQVLKGSATVNGQVLQTSDGVAVSEESSLNLSGSPTAEVMLFDLG